MQLNIHDSTLKKVGFIKNNLPEALHYYNDNWHRYLTEGTSTFEFSVNKVNPDYALLTLQSYVSFTYDGEDYLFNIINIQQDHSSMTLQCENLNLELICEEVDAYSNNKRHSIAWYLRNAAKITDNIVEIGNNPFSLVDEDTSNPILTFDSTETKLARIISICDSFKAEFQFRTKLKNDGTLQNITLDLYESGGVGQVRKDVTLYYGKNVDGITSTGDRTSTFFNSTTVTDSNGKYDWKAVEGKHYNSEGQLEFYKDAGSNTAYAPLSMAMFPSQIKSTSSDQYTNKNLQTEANSNDSLWDYAVSQFKLYAYPQMTYEVVLAVNSVTNALGNDRKLDIGDTIIVQDQTFDKSEGGLILSARVSEQEISFTNPINNKITFTNFVRLKSDISSDLYGRMKDLVDQSTPYRSELETTNGTQFKNGTGSTTLIARIYFGSDAEETVADNYEWTMDGTVVANVQEITVDASGIDEKAVYVYKATIKDKVVGMASVTITNVNDGEDGKPGEDGEDGRSVVTMEKKYQLTTEYTQPSQEWDDEAWQVKFPELSPINKYLWFINRITFNVAPLTEDTVGLQAVYGNTGDNGDPGKIVSDEEPTTKFKGLTWKYSGITAINASDGTNIQPNTEYYWDGKKWELNRINAHNIDVDELSAISENVGEMKAGSITLNKGDNGGVSIKDGIVKSWDVSKQSDANYPDGYSYTSMGVALDSGGVTLYSSDYGTVVDDEDVIDNNYKVATVRAIAHNSRQDGNVGLVLDVTDPDFPLTINGNVTITGAFTVKPVTSNFNSSNYPGVTMYKYGNLVYMHFVTTNASATVANANIGSLPTGFIPSVQWHITLESKEGVTYRATVNPSGLITATMNIPASTDFRCTVTYPV